MFTLQEKEYLLTLARQAIEHFLVTGEKLVCRRGTACRAPTDRPLTAKRACFVTLKKNIVELRGCVGHLEATQPLYLDVIDNAIAAAFEDDRFFPVTKEELPEIEIEISVLTRPELIDWPNHRAQNIVPLQPTNNHSGVGVQYFEPSHSQYILDSLQVGVDGVIVKKYGKQATYLPQVWDEILDKHDFMSSLCLKAGLEPDAWTKPGIEVWRYQVEILQENPETVVTARSQSEILRQQ